MEMRKAIKAMSKASKVKLGEVAEKMGYKTLTGLSNQLLRNDMKVSTLAKVADACGYDIVLRPRALGLKGIDDLIIVDMKDEGVSADGRD